MDYFTYCIGYGWLWIITYRLQLTTHFRITLDPNSPNPGVFRDGTSPPPGKNRITQRGVTEALVEMKVNKLTSVTRWEAANVAEDNGESRRVKPWVFPETMWFSLDTSQTHRTVRIHPV